MSILRVYDPPECDASGVPLDLKLCRTCRGSGQVAALGATVGDRACVCAHCDGHGSLKAAALDTMGYRSATRVISPYVITIQEWRAGVTSIETSRRSIEFGPLPIRCEDCGHPMSKGTWEPVGPNYNEFTDDSVLEWAAQVLGSGQEPNPAGDDGLGDRVHYSLCDKGCRHGGGPKDGTFMLDCAEHLGVRNRASWRQVDVRTLGWPMDLRPEKLAVLCLRCLAAR